ncbi:hypothetical protein AGLY_018284 [Aphis glycines]|uniref:Uncharacterized protein n=1 Tax=Aphis glycines TaxID=307491 RepID=A0A6G0ST91_APHGL|nr:hypothetical protein AGLY_018284 [Aphis glycines]
MSLIWAPLYIIQGLPRYLHVPDGQQHLHPLLPTHCVICAIPCVNYMTIIFYRGHTGDDAFGVIIVPAFLFRSAVVIEGCYPSAFNCNVPKTYKKKKCVKSNRFQTYLVFNDLALSESTPAEILFIKFCCKNSEFTLLRERRTRIVLFRLTALIGIFNGQRNIRGQLVGISYNKFYQVNP